MAFTNEESRAPWQPGFAATIGICLLAQNLAMGLGYGSFGPLLLSTQEHFEVGRVAAAAGMSLMTLAIGVLSPSAGLFFHKLAARNWMIAGALCSAIGYAGLAAAADYLVALVMYAFIGIGVSLTAILGPLDIVTRWAGARRGRLLAFVNLPILLFASPFAIAILLPLIGRSQLLSGMALLFVLLIPLLFVIDRRPPNREAISQGSKPRERATVSGITRSPEFWLTTVGIGFVAGAGAMLVVHLVPFGVQHGSSLREASTLLSIYAGAGLAGTMMLGWLIDRAGAMTTLVLTNCISGIGLAGLALLPVPTFPWIVALLGVCMVPLLTVHSAAMVTLFGTANAGRAVGLGYAIKLPFLFGFPPLAAALFEIGNTYRMPFILCSGALGAAVLMFLLADWLTRRDRRHNPALSGFHEL